MFLTSDVPASVPSVFQSSWPCTPSSAVKNVVPPASTTAVGLLAGVCGSHVAPAPKAPEPFAVTETWLWPAASAGETPPTRLLPARLTAATAAARTAGLAAALRARRRIALAAATRERSDLAF